MQQSQHQHSASAVVLVQQQSALSTIFWGSPDEARFDQRAIAAVSGYSESWLEKARWAGGGPRFIRQGGTEATDKQGKTKLFGGRVFYRKADVVAWLEEQKSVRTTSECRQPVAA